MQNSTIRFNGLNYNVTKARGVIQLANAIKGNRKRAASAFNAAVPVALGYASIDKDCNLDPINALIAAATAAEKRNLIAYAEAVAPFMAYDSGVFSYVASGAEAAAARVLAVAIPEAFDLKAEAEAIKAAAATPEGIADAEAKAEAEAAALDPMDATKEAEKIAKAIDKSRAAAAALLKADTLPEAARDHLQAALLNLLPLINTNVLAARIGADVDLKAAVNARLEAEAAAAKAAEDRKAAVIQAARISAEAAAATAKAEAVKAAAYMEEKQAAAKAEADAKAAAKAADYAKLTAAAVAKMDAQKRGASLNEIDTLKGAGLLTEKQAEAARKKIAAAAAKAAA